MLAKSVSVPLNALQPRVVCDVDGTLCTTPAAVDYDDPTSLALCRPIWPAIRRVRQAMDRGVRFAFVTGRGQHLEAVTRRQLEGWLETTPLDVRLRPGRWSWQSFHEHKVRETAGAILSIGDRAEDARAAAEADVPFMHADAWWRGQAAPVHPGAAHLLAGVVL